MTVPACSPVSRSRSPPDSIRRTVTRLCSFGIPAAAGDSRSLYRYDMTAGEVSPRGRGRISAFPGPGRCQGKWFAYDLDRKMSATAKIAGSLRRTGVRPEDETAGDRSAGRVERSRLVARRQYSCWSTRRSPNTENYFVARRRQDRREKTLTPRSGTKNQSGQRSRFSR